MTAAPALPGAAAPRRVAGGVGFVLVSEALLWSRRQALDLSLRALLAAAGAIAALAMAGLPAIGALVGHLGVSAGPTPEVVPGLLLLGLSGWGTGRLLGTLPGSRRLAAQQPADLCVYQALGSHPRAVLAARIVIPAWLTAGATALFALGLLAGVALAGGRIGPFDWLAAVGVPAGVAVVECRLLRRPPAPSGRLHWAGVAMAVVAGGLVGTLIASLDAAWMWSLPDEAVLAFVAAGGRWGSTIAPGLVGGVAVLACTALLLPEATATYGREGQRPAPVTRPWPHLSRLCLARGEQPAVATHRRLSRAAWLAGWAVVGGAAATMGGAGVTSGPLRLGAIGLLSMAAMALAISQASGLGLPSTGGALRWLHDAGVPAFGVAGHHLFSLLRQLLLTLGPAIAGTAALTRSGEVAVAGLTVVVGALAAASLGDLVDTTRTAHADDSGESGIIGGLVTALLQALLTSPWGGLFTGGWTPAVVAAGVAAPLAALALTTVLTVRRIHP